MCFLTGLQWTNVLNSVTKPFFVCIHSKHVPKMFMSTPYLKATITTYSPVSFCRTLWFFGSIFCLLCLQRFWFLGMLCWGEKGISGPAPAPRGSCCTTLSSVPYEMAGVGHGGGREEEAGRGAAAAPTATHILPFSRERCWQELGRQEGQEKAAGGWLKLFVCLVLLHLHCWLHTWAWKSFCTAVGTETWRGQLQGQPL